jgi:hypothetical protein
MKPVDIDTLTMIRETCNKNYYTINDYDDYYLGIYGVTLRRIHETITSLKKIQLHTISIELRMHLYSSIYINQ